MNTGVIAKIEKLGDECEKLWALSPTMVRHLVNVAYHLNGMGIAGSGGNLPPRTARALHKRGLIELVSHAGKGGRLERPRAYVSDKGFTLALAITTHLKVLEPTKPL